MSDAATEIASRVVLAVKAGLDVDISPAEALVRPAAAGRGWDYQSNVAMGLAKRQALQSRDIAATIVDRLGAEDLADLTIAGPGFINFRLRNCWIEQRLAEQAGDERLGIPPAANPRRMIVDYSGPNVAKEMHVGHLRSTIIGDALARMLAFVGHEVVPQNHLGDWGTPFGMLIEHLLGSGRSDATEASIGDLNAFYQAARVKFDTDREFQQRARRRVVRLQRGDPDTVRLWNILVTESERHFDEIYRLLGVLLEHDHLTPESSYNDHLDDLVRALTERGLTIDSDGATCLFPPGFTGRTGEPMPLIVRKQDGGYTYDTTDLAAIRHRICDLHATELLYVVGAPQRLHFEMVFAAARMAGWLTGEIEARHVCFGSVLGEDNKMLRTRAGVSVRLVDLLEEAIDRSRTLLAGRDDVDDALRAELAHAIGIGAVKYADLSTDRERDYVFSLDRMLSLDGNTSVYLQYANARARSVIARGAERGAMPSETFRLIEPAERSLALRLSRLPSVLDDVLAELKPHRLCTYLYDTAAAFSSFYQTCPVLGADGDEVRASRLALCELTSRVLTRGLDLLGIPAPEQL